MAAKRDLKVRTKVRTEVPGRRLNKLTAREVAGAKDGSHSDGGGLYLRVQDGGRRRSWVFRFTRNGKTSEMGLGRVTLAMAREEAKRLREMIAEGKNPVAERRRVEAEKANRKTFAEVAQFVIERERNGWGAGSLASWERSLFRDAKTLAETNVDAVAVEHVKQVVTPIFDRGNHVAARRTLSRIESVLDCAIAHGWRSMSNVAAWNVQKHIVPKRPKEDRHHPMLPWRDAPAAIAELRASDTMSARCIEFVALTGVRLTEARAAKWSEFDFDNALWVVPRGRMKMRATHTVPLSRQTLALLESLKEHRTGPLVFFGQRRGPVTRHACWMQCRRATGDMGSPHGWRATFRSWCADNGVDREVAESALAHKLGPVEAAYNRASMVERRKPIMQAWGAFLAGDSSAAVVPFRR
jgi:integrase